LSLRVDPDDRIALLGANGNGKSTLIKLLAGRLAPLRGLRRASGKLKVGYFAQHQADELDLAATPFGHMKHLMPKSDDAQVRAHLGRFGFTQMRAEVKAVALSGGEKARLLFALMSRNAPNLMLLDEPTNHLDIDAREALVEALNDYDGAVIIVSHDPHTIELTADRLWLVKDGTVAAYEGDLDDYRALLLDERRGKSNGVGKDETGNRSGGDAGKLSKRDIRRANADARAAVAHLKRAAEAAGRRVERLMAEMAKLEARLAEPEAYLGPTARLMELQIQLGDVKRALASAEEAWLTAQEALDTANAVP
ncbi:MAG TPA: ATP-binding cassette domain-containing protein, partial [Alphaproteobacteria bacterium]